MSSRNSQPVRVKVVAVRRDRKKLYALATTTAFFALLAFVLV